MTVKTTLHCQGYEDWLKEVLATSGTTWIKFVNFFPIMPSGIRIIGRVRAMDEAASDALVARGEAGAVEYAQAVFPEQDKNRHVDIWEGPNEVSIWNAMVLAGFHDFYQRLIQLYHAEGFPIMAGQFNVGWPYLPSDDGGQQSAICGRAIQGADGVSFHEYDASALWAQPGYTCLRYRKTVAYWQSLGLQVPPVFITELGLDAPGGPDFGHSGWKIITADADHPDGNLDLYIDQLCWYEAELQKDAYVQAATIFSILTNWNTFALDHGQCMELARALKEVEPPPPVERARGLDLNMFSGDVNFDALKAAGYKWVGIRFTGPNADRTKLIVDPNAYTYHAGAGDAGLLRLGYHGLMVGVDGQAKFFVDAVGGRKLEMGYYSDLEARALTDDKIRVHLEAVDRRIAEAHGLEPGIYDNVYTSPGFMEGRDGSWGKGRELWLAHWLYDPALEPTVPAPWSDWHLWQYTNLGTDVPGTEKRVCLDLYNGTVRDLYEEYGEPENGGNGGNDVIEIVDRNGDPVVIDGQTWTWESVQRDYGLSLTKATPPEGATVFRLVRLIYDASADTNWRLYVVDEDGRPLQGIVGFLGILPDSGQELEPDQAPRLSEAVWAQPEGRPNRALVLQPPELNFTNLDGYIQHSLGSGSNYVPPVLGGSGGGTHWSWIMPGDYKWFSDVPAGFGLWDNHKMFWPVFQQVTEEDPTPPPPTPGSWTVKGDIRLTEEIKLMVDLVVAPVEEPE